MIDIQQADALFSWDDPREEGFYVLRIRDRLMLVLVESVNGRFFVSGDDEPLPGGEWLGPLRGAVSVPYFN